MAWRKSLLFNSFFSERGVLKKNIPGRVKGCSSMMVGASELTLQRNRGNREGTDEKK